MTARQPKRKRHRQVATPGVCFNPEKQRHTFRVARLIAAKQGSHVYPCGNHYHITHKSWGAP